jgi:hypothetical protein
VGDSFNGMLINGSAKDFGITLRNTTSGGKIWQIDSTGTNSKWGIAGGQLVFWNSVTTPNPTLVLSGGYVYMPSLQSWSTASTPIHIDSMGQLYKYSSDIRLKKNIVSISDQMNVLESLKKLRGVYFDSNKSIEVANNLVEQRQLGMIAQEVEPVLPELVTTGSDGYKSIHYENLTAFLIEVCKEQQKQIEGQQKQIDEQKMVNDEQKKVNDDLKARLEKLESR